MDATIEAIIINTYNPDNHLRSQAEASLALFLKSSGSLVVLLNFVSNVHMHRDLRQAGAITIKNKLREFWSESTSEHQYNLTIEEKEVFKQVIVNVLLVELDNSVRGLLAEILKVVAEFEYPEK